MSVDVEAYRDDTGQCPFEKWFDDLPSAYALKVTVALERIASGNRSQLKPVGHGVSEWRVNWGPGLRIYLGFDGPRMIILLGGGNKARQQADIAQATARWRDYTTRKKARG